MSDERKHIDELFRAGLYNHPAVPPKNAWAALESRLDRIIALNSRRYYLRIAAAILLLIGSGGVIMHYLIQDTDSYLLPREVEPLTESVKNEHESPFVIPVTSPESYIPEEERTRFTEQIVRDPSLPGAPESYKPAPLKFHNPAPLISGFRPAKLKKESVTGLTEFEETASSVSGQRKRWFAGVMVAPNYSYRTLYSGQSAYLEILTYNNSEKGLLTLSGSLSLRYEFNNRLSLQSGLDLTKMGQSIGGIQVDMDPSPLESVSREGQKRSISTSQPVFNSYGDISISATSVTVTDRFIRFADGSVGTIPGDIFPDETLNQGTVVQSLYYIQVPLLLRYRVITGDTGLSLISGVGGNMLAGNSVILRHMDETYKIGQTLNLNRYGLSGILALSFEHKVGNNIFMVIEPRVSHFITPVNTEGNHFSLPYSVSIFGGITYRF
jgi:hypothetical protein